MKKILAYITTPLFKMSFISFLIIFHPIQVIAFKFFGVKAHQKTVGLLNYCLVSTFRIVGSKIKFINDYTIPTDRPIIVISNHQSTFDVSPISWVFRKNGLAFIAKKELAKGIPSVSYNLRKSGAALIDRKKRDQAIPQIMSLGKRIVENNSAACIFPEGTRSKTGNIRKFQPGGINALLKTAPNALIIPFVIDGNLKMENNGSFFCSFGESLTYKVLEPIEPNGRSSEELTSLVEEIITKAKEDLENN